MPGGSIATPAIFNRRNADYIPDYTHSAKKENSGQFHDSTELTALIKSRAKIVHFEYFFHCGNVHFRSV